MRVLPMSDNQIQRMSKCCLLYHNLTSILTMFCKLINMPTIGFGGRELQGWTPLHKAARNGHGPVVERLIGVGAVVDAVANDGAGPRGVVAGRVALERCKICLDSQSHPWLLESTVVWRVVLAAWFAMLSNAFSQSDIDKSVSVPDIVYTVYSISTCAKLRIVSGTQILFSIFTVFFSPSGFLAFCFCGFCGFCGLLAFWPCMICMLLWFFVVFVAFFPCLVSWLCWLLCFFGLCGFVGFGGSFVTKQKNTADSNHQL